MSQAMIWLNVTSRFFWGRTDSTYLSSASIFNCFIRDYVSQMNTSNKHVLAQILVLLWNALHGTSFVFLHRTSPTPNTSLVSNVQPYVAISSRHRRGYRKRSSGRLVVTRGESHTHNIRIKLLTSLFTTLPGARMAYAIVVRAVAGVD